MTDREKFIATARTYIGKTGRDICINKLKLGMIVDWCAYSISAIMKDCGFIGKYQGGIYGYASDAAREDNGKYGTWFKKGEKTPQPGDYIMFRYASFTTPLDKYSASHVGIVEAVNGNTLTTLEGNVDGYGDNWAGTSSYKRKTRYLSSSDIYAFYRPYWQNEDKTTNTSTANNTANNTTSTAIQGGTKLTLKAVPLYMTSTAKSKSGTRSGTYYAWSKDTVNGRIRITDTMNHVGKVGQVTGWINYTDAQKSVVSSKKSIDTIAREVIQGKWGNGDVRKNRLTKAGYNYTAVQNKVNELLG